MKKKWSFILAAVMTVSLFSGCSGAASSSDAAAKKVSSDTSYESTLFDTSYVHAINIEISESDWSDLLANPLDKTKYKVNVSVDGEQVDSVSFATKGNTSLSSVASDEDSDRYSFKINFGKYVDGQTYRGLDKLNLSNIYADTTYMKDYMSYEIFRQIGVESALTSYVWVTVNGEDYGLYLAVEDIADSYLDRTEDGEGELYKPETEQLNNADNQNMDKTNMDKTGIDRTDFSNGDNTDTAAIADMKGKFNADTTQNTGNAQNTEDQANGMMPGGIALPDDMTLPEGTSLPDGMTAMDGQAGTDGTTDGTVMGGMRDNNGQKGFGMSGDDNGASLMYTDDDIDSYSDIFDNAETDAKEEDMQRVIAALKQLSAGSDLESCLDTDSIIRYFVAHNFVMNYDSYTGNMLHNYYLYENDGQISILPWDYNLAYGTFMNASDSTSVINYGIDTPLSGATEDERPIWSWITSNEEYLEKYHTYFTELLTKYFESGSFENEMSRVYDMILPYVEKDPTAFYSSSEFTQGFNTLKQFCLLRAQSIRKQLSGTLSTKTSEQNAADQVDASSINIQDMGSQSGGKMNGQDNQQNQTGMPEMQNGQGQTGMPDMQNGQGQTGMPEMQNGQGQTGMPEMQNGQGQTGMPEMQNGQNQAAVPGQQNAQ